MGQYVVVENDGRYCFNLCASNGHILASSIIFPSHDECMQGMEAFKKAVPKANIEDSTIDAFAREESPKFRIYEDMEGRYFFRVITEEAGDIARSHSYEHKESLMRRIEHTQAEVDSSLAFGE